MVDGIVSYYILFKWLHLKKNVKYVQIFYLMHTDICTCVLKHNNYNAKFSPDKNIQQIQKNTTAIQLLSGIRSHPTQATHTHLLSCFPVICGMDVAIPLPPAFVKKWSDPTKHLFLLKHWCWASTLPQWRREWRKAKWREREHSRLLRCKRIAACSQLWLPIIL